MPDEATETREELHGDGHGPPDKSPRRTEVAPRPQRAEVTNYEIVGHWFGLAAERLGLRDDIAAVLRSSYREVGAAAREAERRQDSRLLRLPRTAQRRARPLQGRNPLPPRGRPRRGAGARRADDVENGNRRGFPSAARRAASTSAPRKLEPKELQAVTRSFMDKVEKVLGPTRDIPAPDVGTDAQVMAWLMDQYGKCTDILPPA